MSAHNALVGTTELVALVQFRLLATRGATHVRGAPQTVTGFVCLQRGDLFVMARFVDALGGVHFLRPRHEKASHALPPNRRNSIRSV